MGELSYRVSADIGGTFTDLVVEPSEGPMIVGKVSTTPDDPARAVVEGLVELIPDLSRMTFFVHGTTVGLNAFLERKGERVLLVTTSGHRDGYIIARGNRPDLYELCYRKPTLLVPRRDVYEVRERMSWDGEIVESLREEDFDLIIAKAKSEGIQAIAVCFLHAFAFPVHEIRAGEILRAALPDAAVSLSHEVASEWREYERASSVVMNAYISLAVQRYLSNLQRELLAKGVQSKVHVMQSNGGIISAEAAQKNPVHTLLSGPVGGAVGGIAVANAIDCSNLLCVDMGGTSFDLSLVVNGKANATRETELKGLPLLMSCVDIRTIGTGGGSVVWLESGGVRVGPHSAGAIPGPACYGLGGMEPTVTDANLYLGRLGKRSLLGGDMTLDLSAASGAIEKHAGQAGMKPQEFAEGILSISNAAMADAIRTVTVEQGVDARGFTLAAFGGAGPMAAAFLASELDINEVLIPRFPGAFSAWGMLQTDLRRDYTRSFCQATTLAHEDTIDAIFSELEEEGRCAMAEEGIKSQDLTFDRAADMHYIGQEYTIDVSMRAPTQLAIVVQDFHVAYKNRYGHSSPEASVEFVNLRVAACGSLAHWPQAWAPVEEGGISAVIGERQVMFDSVAHSTPILSRERLPASFQADGPMIIEEHSATSVVPPGWQVTFDAMGNLLIHKGASQ